MYASFSASVAFGRRVSQVLLLSSFCCFTHRFYAFQFPWFLTFIVVKIFPRFHVNN